MDFSITQLIVVPTDNSVPTSGSPYEMSVGQVGIFKSDYTAATSASVANEPYIYIAQGRDVNGPLPSDRSDKIAKKKLIEYSKVTGSDVAANEIWEVSDFNVKCEDDVVLSIKAHSYFLDTAFFNGLTRSVVVKAPCCDCGGDPCDTVDQEKVVDLLIEKLNQDFNIDRATVNLNKYFDFLKIGSGADTKLRIVAKPLTREGQGCDLALNPHQFDRLWFRPFITKGVPTTADFLVYDRCDEAGTTTLIQRSTYAKLTSEEVKSLEKDYYSYKVPNHKELFRMGGYNPYFKSYVEDGQVYDQYLVKYGIYDNQGNWQDFVIEDEQTILLVPTGETDLASILTAYFGNPVDESGKAVTTTTTTSTTSTSTSTTTVQFP